jgi:hypothetical protein
MRLWREPSSELHDLPWRPAARKLIPDDRVNAMDVLLILTLGAFSGFILAQFASWYGLVWCGPVVAAISAVILQKHGFRWLSGIAVTVACLSLNQLANLSGLISRSIRRATTQVMPERRSQKAPAAPRAPT